MDARDLPAVAGGRPVREAFLPFGRASLGEEEEREVIATLRSGWLATGPRVTRFEGLLREVTGAEHAVALGSCTAALELALYALGVGPGDEVLVPAITFSATANAVVRVGAVPVLVDVEPAGLNLDVGAARRAVTDRTRAVIPVHMAGAPMDMNAVRELADRHDLLVVEDAAHAIGAMVGGDRVGSLPGTAATCLSFYPIKNITSIEGGALLTSDADLAARVRTLALHGLSRGAWNRYGTGGWQHWEALESGFKATMTDVQAAVGIHQVPRLPGFLARRAEIAARYTAELGDLPAVELPARTPGVSTAWHLFVVLLRLEELTCDRDAVLSALPAENIGVGVHFRSLGLQPAHADAQGADALPVATALSERLFSRRSTPP